MESTNSPQTFSLANKKVLYVIITVIVLITFGLYTLFSSLNRDNKALTKKVVNQTEIVVNQSLLITNLNQKNLELATLLKSYDNKLSILHTNLTHLQSITEKLKVSSDEKDVKIKDLSQEKSALESDLKSLRNTLVKMTKEIVDLSDELKVAKTDKDQNELVAKIEELTKERDFLKNKIVEYEKIIEELKRENALLAQNLRQNMKKSGYEFKNKLGEWPKGAEVLMKISNQHSNNLSKEINQVDESKQEEKPKKVGFWKRIFGSNADE
jgi:predicted  nucleic acid-binding Zn-ribbon protein